MNTTDIIAILCTTAAWYAFAFVYICYLRDMHDWFLNHGPDHNGDMGMDPAYVALVSWAFSPIWIPLWWLVIRPFNSLTMLAFSRKEEEEE